jgi:hypothetical protein
MGGAMNEIEGESDSFETIQLCSGEDGIWDDAIAIFADTTSVPPGYRFYVYL